MRLPWSTDSRHFVEIALKKSYLQMVLIVVKNNVGQDELLCLHNNTQH